MIFILKHFNRWLNVLLRIQRDFNNFININSLSNKIAYKFTLVQTMNLKKLFAVSNLSLKNNRLITRLEVANAIAFAQISVKFYYNRKHQFMFMKQNDYALIKLYKGYNIPAATNRKYNQQFVKPFRITKKIKRFAYRLAISETWRIHSIFSIAQLKNCSSSSTNFFNRFKPNYSNSVYVDENTENVKFFELSCIINKRKIKIKNTKYLIQWKGYNSKHNA